LGQPQLGKEMSPAGENLSEILAFAISQIFLPAISHRRFVLVLVKIIFDFFSRIKFNLPL
jgi:hypothetical protein